MQDTSSIHAAAGEEGALVAMVPCDKSFMPGGVLLTSQRDGARIVVMQEVAVALQQCNSFRTLQEHAEFLVQRFPQLQGNREDALRVLGLVREAGLMASADELCVRVNAGGAQSLPRQEQTVTCVLTCDRPEALARLFDSMLRNARLSRQKSLFLIDDSRDPANVARNAELVADFSRVSPVNMLHVDPEYQAQLVADLKSALPEHVDAIDWLLAREGWGGLPTYGRARNVALLLSVGERCLMLDDDIICKAYPAVHKADSAPFNAPREAHCFARQPEWLHQLVPMEADPLVEHGRGLGQPIGEAMQALGQGAAASSLRRCPGRVHGQGDRGLAHSHYTVRYSGRSRYRQ